MHHQHKRESDRAAVARCANVVGGRYDGLYLPPPGDHLDYLCLGRHREGTMAGSMIAVYRWVDEQWQYDEAATREGAAAGGISIDS